MLHTILYDTTVSSSCSEPLAVFTIRVSTVSVTISVPYHGLLQFSRYGFLLYLFQYQYRTMVRVAVDSYCRQCRCDVGTCRSPLALLPPLPRRLVATHAALTRHRRWRPSRMVHTDRSVLVPPLTGRGAPIPSLVSAVHHQSPFGPLFLVGLSVVCVSALAQALPFLHFAHFSLSPTRATSSPKFSGSGVSMKMVPT